MFLGGGESLLIAQSFVYYMHCRWISRREDWDAIKKFNSATCLCLSQTRIWISSVIYHGHFGIQCVQLIVRFVDTGGIDDYHCLNFILMISATM